MWISSFRGRVQSLGSCKSWSTIFMVDSNLEGCWRLESHPNAGPPQGVPLAAVTPPCGDVLTAAEHGLDLRYRCWHNCLQFNWWQLRKICQFGWTDRLKLTSSDGTVIGLQSAVPRNHGSIPVQASVESLLHSSQTDSGGHPALCSLWAVSMGVNRTGRQAD